MALTRKFFSGRSKQVRRNAAGSRQGSGDDVHAITGSTGKGSTEYLYRSLIAFATNYTGMARIVKVELALKTDTSSTHFTVGAKPRTEVHLLAKGQTFTDGTAAEGQWIAGDYQWPAGYSAQVQFDSPINPATGKPTDEAWVFTDITALWKVVTPNTVHFADGSVGGGQPNNGIILKAPGDEKNDAQRMIFYTRDKSGTTNDPYLLVTYDQGNQAPTAPTLMNPPTSGSVGFGGSFEGQHHDPDGDPMSARLIRVWTKPAGAKPAWELPSDLQPAGSSEVQTGIFSVPLSLAAGVLKSQTDYEWDAATKDTSGVLGPYSAKRALRITSLVPNPPTPSNVGNVDNLATQKFGGVYSDPEGNPLSMFELQMQAGSGHTDAAFSDPSAFVWATGETIPTAEEIANGIVARDYAGRPLGVGGYTYRIRFRDSTGNWSVWSYDDWTLTVPYNIDPGNQPLVTQLARFAPIRIALYSVYTDWPTGTTKAAGRGPGKLIGYLDDPVDLGASAFLNGGGEVYFSLPALHPYCPEIEPHRVHYQVQQYYGDRYRTLFAGLITDFDADAESVTFYGVDYLGLLQTAVDERYDVNNAELAANMAGGGGSKYSDKTLDAIIKDQLLYHKNNPNSPVGFISATGPITALAERATIYSTYAEALPFITGLIDSHKQGTGRECRFYARPLDTTFLTWEWAVIDNWGRDRPNIRLEYGGLVNDFRVVALGDFGTRVLAVGQKRGEVKVYRANSTGGLDEASWGRRAKTAFFQDIVDQNDLQRRANENASVLAKIGKRLALALAADMLSPFDGWDLGDSINVDIERGVVYTPNYGSLGLWTIYGVEWRYARDGHTDMTLTVLPKKVATTAPIDLIPSVNPGIPNDWQVGYGVPTVFGVPPSPTPPPSGLFAASQRGVEPGQQDTLPLSEDPVIAQNYQDLNTGCIYEVDETTALYTVVYCPPSGSGGVGPAGPPGPVGPEGPEGPAGEPAPPDLIPPPQPTFKSLTSQLQDGQVAITGTVGFSAAPALDDLAEYVIQSTRFPLADPTQPDWTKATQWTAKSVDAAMAPDVTGNFDSPFVQPNVLPGAKYWLRVAAVDKASNRSVWSVAGTFVTTEDDLLGPPQPSGAVPQPGHTSFGLRWAPIDADDYDYVEVQWKLTTDPDWVNSVRVAGTMVVITGVENDKAYSLRLRSVDTSGNTADAAGSAKVDDQTRGWVIPSPATVTPSAINGDDIHWTPAMFTEIFAGQINADWIRTGTLRAGNAPDLPIPPPVPAVDVVIEVYNATGQRTGTWGPNGIRLTAPPNPAVPGSGNPGYMMELTETGLFIWADYGQSSAYKIVSLTPTGIDAASITFGSARGGHNLVQNSSFEIGPFVQVVALTSQWDVAADWNAAGSRQGADINISTGAGALTMAAI